MKLAAKEARLVEQAKKAAEKAEAKLARQAHQQFQTAIKTARKGKKKITS